MADDTVPPSAPTPFPWETIMWVIVECGAHPGIAQALEALRNAEVAWNAMLRHGVDTDTATTCAGDIALDFLAPHFGDRWSPWGSPATVI